MVLTKDEQKTFNDIRDSLSIMKEEFSRLHNKLDAMNSYYADIVTKTLIKEKDIKDMEKSKIQKVKKKNGKS